LSSQSVKNEGRQLPFFWLWYTVAMKKLLSLLSAALVVASFSCSVQPAKAAGGAPEPTRLAGADRFLTAVEISQWSFVADDSAPTVYLFNSDNPVDALAAIPLTDVHADTRGPLLPVKNGTELTAEVHMEINRVLCDTCVVTILGGTAAISEDVVDALDGSYVIDRIAGETRFDTAAAIAARVSAALAPNIPDLFIVNSSAFTDALAVGPLAGSFDSEFTPYSFAGGVVLLTYADGAPRATTDFIDQQVGGWINIVGGQSVVSEEVARSLSARHSPDNVETYFTRFDGLNRFQTAHGIADRFFQNGSPSYDHAFGVANGATIADALPGGALMAKYTMPLLLTSGENLNCETALFIESDLGQTKDSYVFGGTAAVTQTAFDQMSALLNDLTTPANLGC